MISNVFVIADDNQVRAQGTFNNLYLVLHETTPEEPVKGELGARVLLHEKGDSPVLLARTHSMAAELAWSREVKLELRKVSTCIQIYFSRSLQGIAYIFKIYFNWVYLVMFSFRL